MESYWLDPHNNDLCDGGVTVAEFETEDECNFAAYLLSERGINSAIRLPARRFDLTLPQVRVSPDDESVARGILAESVTVAKRAEYEAEPEYEPFMAPCCLRCKSSDVVLESVTNENSWRCEVCGARWKETPQAAEQP